MTNDLQLIDGQAEHAAIAAMVNDTECLEIGLAELTQDHFGDNIYRHIFGVIGQMYNHDQQINSVSVWEKVKTAAREYGLKAVLDDYIGKAVFESYVARLKTLAKNRQLFEISQQIVEEIKNQADADQIAAAVEDAVYSLGENKAAPPIVTPKEQAEEILETVAAQMDESQRKQTSIYTSFPRLNYLTGGFEAGDLVIISGPTGGGKTALTMNLMRDIALTQKLPCLHINTEMSKKQIAIRWAAILGKDYLVNNATIRAGDISPEQFSRLVADLDPMNNGELYSVTIPDLTVPTMLTTIRRFSRQKHIRAVAVDYIGRVDTMNSTKDDWKQLLSAAKKLKTIGQQFGLVMLMIAQNNSEGNLAMAGYMEHEADLHIHIRPLSEEEQDKYIGGGEPYWNYALIIKKARSAPQRKIPIRFVGEKLTFVMDAKEAQFYASLAGEQQQPATDYQAASYPRKSYNRGGYGKSQRRTLPFDD